MGILVTLCACSIMACIMSSVLYAVGMEINKHLRRAIYIIVLPAFFGAMLLVATIGEIEKLHKERVDTYEMISYPVYKKK
jgi:hypothetical protein